MPTPNKPVKTAERPDNVKRVLNAYVEESSKYSWGRGDIAPLLQYILQLESTAQQRMAEWQNISSAPKDGTTILLAKWRSRPQGGWQYVTARWFKVWEEKEKGDFIECWMMTMMTNPQTLKNWNPTHWQPLPQPPLTNQGRE